MKLLSRSWRLAAVTLAVAGLVAAPGCKDDDKTDEAAEQKEQAGEEGAEEAEGAEGEAEGETAKKAGAAATRRVSISDAAPDMPGSVVTVAGSPSLDRVLAAASEIGNKVAPGQLPPDLKPLVMQQAKSILGFGSVDWLKTDAPIAGFKLDPKAYEGGGQGIVLPMSDRDAVLAALKEGADKEVEGHAAKFEHQYATWFVDFVDGHVVLTDHDGAFRDTKPFIEGELVDWTPERLLMVHVNMESVQRVFGKEIEGFESMAGQMAAQAGQDPDLPDAGQAIQQYVELLFGFVKSTKRIDLALFPEGDDLDLALSFRSKPGTNLEKFAGRIVRSNPELLAFAPKSTWLGLASDMNVLEIESLRKAQKASLSGYARALRLSAAEEAKLGELFDRLTEQSTGQSLTAFYTEGRFPVAVAGLTKVEDAGAARKTYGELVDLLFEKIWTLAVEQMKEDGTAVPGAEEVESPEDLVTMANQMAAQFGVKLALSHEEADGAHVDALVIEADWDKMGIQETDPEVYRMLDDVVGERLEMAFAFKDTNVGMGFGPKGAEVAKKLAQGEEMGGSKALTEASRGQAFALALQAGALMKALKFLPDLKDMRARIEALPSEPAYTFTTSGDGEGITIQLGVPIELTSDLVKLSQ